MGAAVAGIISALVGGGESLYGADKQSSANLAATKLQTDAAVKAAQLSSAANAAALQVQKDQLAYEQQQAAQQLAIQKDQIDYQRQQTQAQQNARAPYVALGNSALTNLGQLLHVQVPQFPTAGGVAPAPPGSTAQPAPNPALAQMPPPVGPAAPSVQQPTTLASMALPSQPTLMRAPDGSTGIVPPEKVQLALSKGFVPAQSSGQQATMPQPAPTSA